MNDFISQLFGPEIHPVSHARAVRNLTSRENDDDVVICDEPAVFSCTNCGRDNLRLNDFYFRCGKKTNICKKCKRTAWQKEKAAKRKKGKEIPIDRKRKKTSRTPALPERPKPREYILAGMRVFPTRTGEKQVYHVAAATITRHVLR
jgi:hypothetical protein